MKRRSSDKEKEKWRRQKSTSRRRKMLEHIEPKVLVGFGKCDLKDLIELRGTPLEDNVIVAPLKAPPRWKRASICTPEEISTFTEYTRWVQEKLKPPTLEEK